MERRIIARSRSSVRKHAVLVSHSSRVAIWVGRVLERGGSVFYLSCRTGSTVDMLPDVPTVDETGTLKCRQPLGAADDKRVGKKTSRFLIRVVFAEVLIVCSPASS